MAWGNFILDKGFDLPAGGSCTKYRALKFTGNSEEVNVVTAITDNPAGWVQYSVSASEQARGKGASVRMAGVTEAEAAGAIGIGALCQLENDGRVSAVVAASGKRIVGQCVGSPAVNAGDRIAMFIIKGGALA